MTTADEIRNLFSGHRFGSPCTEADVCGAEAALGERLPNAIRELYLTFDGFLAKTDASFFWPPFGRDGLIETNQFLRSGPEFPHELVSNCVFFGDNGCGAFWGIKRDLPDKVIQWDGEWGADFSIVGDSPLAAWRAEKQMYDSLTDCG